jgi:hypothetical protein
MRYAPKEKMYARMMALTSWINIAIRIDCVGVLWEATNVAQKGIWDVFGPKEGKEATMTGC